MLCTGPEECIEHADECNTDRMSEINEEGECDVQCAAGYGGDQCNSENIFTNSCSCNSLHKNIFLQTLTSVKPAMNVMIMQSVMILMVATGVSVCQDSREMDTTVQV